MSTRYEEIPAIDTSTGAADAYALVLLNAAGYLDITLFTGDLGALEALSTTGIVTRTAASTYATRTLTAPAAGFTITNPAGIAGNPTFVLADDLGALEGLGSTGIAVRTAANTWAQRQVVAPAAGITVTNPAGVAGDITLALANDLALLEALTGAGIACRSVSNTWNLREIAVGSSKISVSNATGGSGNPTIDVVEANLTLDNIGGTLGVAKGGSLSGTYTPTLANISNGNVLTASVCQYMRAGNVVTVSGKFNASVTTGTTQTIISITLPIASALANDYEAGGAGGGYNATAVIPLYVNAEPTNNVARVIFVPPNTTARDYWFSFTYLVI